MASSGSPQQPVTQLPSNPQRSQKQVQQHTQPQPQAQPQHGFWDEPPIQPKPPQGKQQPQVH